MVWSVPPVIRMVRLSSVISSPTIFQRPSVVGIDFSGNGQASV